MTRPSEAEPTPSPREIGGSIYVELQFKGPVKRAMRTALQGGITRSEIINGVSELWDNIFAATDSSPDQTTQIVTTLPSKRATKAILTVKGHRETGMDAEGLQRFVAAGI